MGTGGSQTTSSPGWASPVSWSTSASVSGAPRSAVTSRAASRPGSERTGATRSSRTSAAEVLSVQRIVASRTSVHQREEAGRRTVAVGQAVEGGVDRRVDAGQRGEPRGVLDQVDALAQQDAVDDELLGREVPLLGALLLEE